MNKKNAKMLSGTLAATTVLTSAMGAAPVFAKGTDWNKVYENAYKAMQKAEQDKTQESINAARKAIAELAKNKNLMPLVGTLSEHVDGVQQGLFNDFYSLMYVDGKEKSRMSQKEINQARECVSSFATCDVNKQYTESWSTAVDKFQQNNVNEMTAAVKKAQETKDAKDIEAAKTLVAELETSTNKDVLNATAAEKAKVETVEKEIEKENAKLIIEKVSSTNYKEVVVTFNKEVEKESAENIKNYKLTTKTASLEHGKAELSKDGKTVVLTLGTAATKQENAKLEIANVKEAKGNQVVKDEKELTFLDVTIPTTGKVNVVGPRTVEVEFSEPMTEAPTVVLDNGQVSSTVELSENHKKAIVKFALDLTEGTHNLTIEGGKDFAEYKIVKEVKSFKYEKNTKDVSVTVEKCDQTTATIKFDRPVKINKEDKVAAYHTYNNSEKYKAESIKAVKAVDGYSDTYEITFEAPMAERKDNKIFLNTVKDAFQDRWGNDVVSTELTVEVVVDKTAPVVSEIKAEKDKELTIKFDEKVEKADAENKDNYVLKANGKVLTNKDYDFLTKDGKFTSRVGLAYDEEKQTVKVNLPKSLDGGNYVLTVNNIQDKSYNKNKMTNQDVKFVVNDTTAPTIALAIKSENKVRVIFSEAMSTDGLTKLTNYEFLNDNVVVKMGENASVKVIDSKTVEIDLDVNANGVNTVRVNGNLKDAAGNKIEGVSASKAVTSDAIIAAQIKNNTVLATSTSTVEFVVEQELDGNLNPAKFTVNDKQVAEAKYINKDGKALVTLTVKDADKFEPSATPKVEIAEGALQNKFAGKNTEKITVNNAIDAIAPEVAKIKDSKENEVSDIQIVDENVQITFTENINENSISTQTFQVEGFVVTGKAINDKVLTLTVKSLEGENNELVSGLAVTQKSAITDVAGNKMEGFVGKISDSKKAQKEVVANKVNAHLDQLTVKDLQNAEIADVNAGNIEAVKVLVQASDNKDLATVAKLVKQVNENVTLINKQADVKVATYTNAGIKDVKDDNLDKVNAAVKEAQKQPAPVRRLALAAAEPQARNLSASEIQVLVKNVNAEMKKEADKADKAAQDAVNETAKAVNLTFDNTNGADSDAPVIQAPSNAGELTYEVEALAEAANGVGVLADNKVTITRPTGEETKEFDVTVKVTNTTTKKTAKKSFTVKVPKKGTAVTVENK